MSKFQRQNKIIPPLFFDSKRIAEGLSLFSVDYYTVEGKKLKSECFANHNGQSSIILWTDKNKVVKVQVNIAGTVVEWSYWTGLRTGLVCDSEPSVVTAGELANYDSSSNKIYYDRLLQNWSIQQSADFISNIKIIPASQITAIRSNLLGQISFGQKLLKRLVSGMSEIKRYFRIK